MVNVVRKILTICLMLSTGAAWAIAASTHESVKVGFEPMQYRLACVGEFLGAEYEIVTENDDLDQSDRSNQNTQSVKISSSGKNSHGNHYDLVLQSRFQFYLKDSVKRVSMPHMLDPSLGVLSTPPPA